MNARDLDNHITGNYGEDQIRVCCEQCGKRVKGDDYSMVIGGSTYPFCSSGCMSSYAKDNL